MNENTLKKEVTIVQKDNVENNQNNNTNIGNRIYIYSYLII